MSLVHIYKIGKVHTCITRCLGRLFHLVHELYSHYKDICNITPRKTSLCILVPWCTRPSTRWVASPRKALSCNLCMSVDMCRLREAKPGKLRRSARLRVKPSSSDRWPPLHARDQLNTHCVLEGAGLGYFSCNIIYKYTVCSTS